MLCGKIYNNVQSMLKYTLTKHESVNPVAKRNRSKFRMKLCKGQISILFSILQKCIITTHFNILYSYETRNNIYI